MREERVKVETRTEGCINSCMSLIGAVLVIGLVVGLLIEIAKAVFN